MNRPTRYYSKRQEKKVAKCVGGKRQPNSGATPFYKGDVITDQFLIECKTKTADCKSFTIKEDWLLKNEEEAFAMGRESALCFDFGPSANKRYYVISERQFDLLQQSLEEGRI
jgi:hypothetical protein